LRMQSFDTGDGEHFSTSGTDGGATGVSQLWPLEGADFACGGAPTANPGAVPNRIAGKAARGIELFQNRICRPSRWWRSQRQLIRAEKLRAASVTNTSASTRSMAVAP